MNKVATILAFISGAAIGSLVTWKLIESKYKQIAEEEIESVKEVFSRKTNEKEVEEENHKIEQKEIKIKEKPSLKEYSTILQEQGYFDYSTNTIKYKNNKEVDKEVKKPYVISPDDFGEIDDYDTISLTYYSDGILTDDLDDPIDDVDSIVGIESLSRFGEYEDDSVFVRNDDMHTDYEILLDVRNYSDVVNTYPHSVEE